MVTMSRSDTENPSEMIRGVHAKPVYDYPSLTEFVRETRGDQAALRISMVDLFGLLLGRLVGFRAAFADEIFGLRLCFDRKCGKCISADEPFVEFTILEVSMRQQQVFVLYDVTFHNLPEGVASAA